MIVFRRVMNVLAIGAWAIAIFALVITDWQPSGFTIGLAFFITLISQIEHTLENW